MSEDERPPGHQQTGAPSASALRDATKRRKHATPAPPAETAGVRRCHIGLRVGSDLTVVSLAGPHRFILECSCGHRFEGAEQNILEDAWVTCGNHPAADGRTAGEYRRAHTIVRRERGAPGGPCTYCGPRATSGHSTTASPRTMSRPVGTRTASTRSRTLARAPVITDSRCAGGAWLGPVRCRCSSRIADGCAHGQAIAHPRALGRDQRDNPAGVPGDRHA